MNKNIALIILLCPFLLAAKIYKWTDGYGKVHFTQTPGPSQEVNTVYRDTAKKRKYAKSLDGHWFGTSAGRKYKLSFNKGSFSFYDISGQYGNSSIGNGFYEKMSNIIKFKYLNNQQANKKGKLMENYIIRDFSYSRLIIQSPDNKIYRFIKRLKYNPKQSKYAEDLFGVWLNKNNSKVLEFKQSSFLLFSDKEQHKTGLRSSYQGNWTLNMDKIEFQYLGDSKYKDKIGETENYNVIFSKEDLTMTNTKSGKTNRYKKQILDSYTINK